MGKINIQTNEKGQKKAIAPCFQPCPIERGMRILGGKWTGSILWHLKDKPVRFNDLARQLSGASKKVISDRLKEMENNKLIIRTVISTRPVAVTYEITDFGRTTLNFLEDLKEWVEKYDDTIT